jgi:hypothetical protein
MAGVDSECSLSVTFGARERKKERKKEKKIPTIIRKQRNFFEVQKRSGLDMRWGAAGETPKIIVWLYHVVSKPTRRR